MPGSEDDNEEASQLELELYFLIARFLSAGPCKRSADALKEELKEHKLLFRRIDWEGGEHFRSYENLLDIFRHISNDHLLKVARRVGPLLEKDVKSSVRGVSSLLGAGRQSILRTAKDVDHVRWPGATYAASHHGRPLLPPKNLTHTNIVGLLSAYHMSGMVNTNLARYTAIYSRMTRAFRSLGHLSAVYCICFDRTGSFIITGADDHLVKIWSSQTGRLISTLRGHSSEITDIAVNYENTLLAAGSCDKTIRVWCFRTMAPVAVLHGHTGMITSLMFCPYIRADNRYLLSTGGDGCVCFWAWSTKDNRFNSKPIKFIERSRAGVQMLCSSFSPGGVFLATGSSDNVVRVYCFTSSLPEKICELEAHTDRVDSIQYSNHSNRFVSGSKDGNARIWRYERQDWKATVLNAASKLLGASSSDEDTKSNKCKVNMICWSENDQYVIIAVNDATLKVWDSYTGMLLHILTGHTDEVFVLEANPTDPRILLSAGHDGNIILWDIVSGKMITNYFNSIEGQGHGAVYDCKWSPDGQSFATTDSHGFTMLYIFGSNECYKRLPEEMFFHTDYRPLIRDHNNFVLDEQTQQPPHLMPPPFLVDIDGNPHPSWMQRLVPGREIMSDAMLIPQIGFAPNGDREVLDEIPIDDPEPEPEPEAAGQLHNIDAMIERLARRTDNLHPAAIPSPREPRMQSPREDGPLSPPVRGPRRSGEVEGVRAASGHVPVSQRATPRDIAAWRRRVVVWGLDPSLVRSDQELRQALAEDEIKKFVSERKRRPVAGSESPQSSDSGQIRTRRQRTQTQRQRSQRRPTRSNQQTSRNRLTTRALYDTEEEDVDDDEDDAVHRSASEVEVEEEIESDQVWNASSSDSESSEYSDWAADGGVNLQPPKRMSSRQPKKKRFSSSEDEVDDEEMEEEATPSTSQATIHTKKMSKKQPPVKKKDTRKEKQERRNRQLVARQNSIVELPEAFKPPDWLTNTTPRKTPYVPQMGDEVIYFQQGHKLYLTAVQTHNVYNLNITKAQPWVKRPQMRDLELMKVVGLKYEIRPPRLVCLKLAFIDPVTSYLSGGTFTIKYHDMADVIDFLVLKQTYDKAIARNWSEGNKFRSMIDDAWWMGKITTYEPLQAEFPDSMFQCFHVQWDNGERERMSPWDLEPIDTTREPNVVGGSIEVMQQEFSMLIYEPRDNEWPDCRRNMECDRISHGLESIMELSIAEHFLAPVDLNTFPAYAMVIEYPVDLSTIKARLENRYYRRVTSVQYDVRYIETNASKFNQPTSRIVMCAKLITELALRFISDCACTDPMPLYSQLAKDIDFKIPMRSAATTERPEYDEDTEVEVDEPSSSSGRRKVKKKKVLKIPDKNAWKAECRELLLTLMECEDSRPFRAAVDPFEYPTYYEIIDHPMDLGTVREQLVCSVYESPLEFSKDMRLIFNNSRSYNTNKRSRIHTMTLRLAAMFEDQILPINNDYKSALKYEKTGRLPPRLKKQIKKSNGMRQSTSTPRGAEHSLQPGEEGMSSTPNTSHTSNSSFNSSKPTPSSTTARASKTSKRKRISSSEDDGVDSDPDFKEFEAKPRKIPCSVRKKRPMKSSKKRKSLSNGHNSRYGTRTSRGKLKRKSYEDHDSDREGMSKSAAVVESDSATELSDSGEDTEEEAMPKKGTNVKGAARRLLNARMTGKRPKIDDSDTELDAVNDSDADSSDISDSDGTADDSDEELIPVQNSDILDDSNETEIDGESDSDEDDSDSDAGVRRSRRTTTQQNTKATKSVTNEEKRRSLSIERPKRGMRGGSRTPRKSFHDVDDDDGDDDDGDDDESSDDDVGGGDALSANRFSAARRPKLRVNTRNAGRRTVRYEEDSDYEVSRSQRQQLQVEYQSDNSESETEPSLGFSTSSRGRIRKLTARARASFLSTFS